MKFLSFQDLQSVFQMNRLIHVVERAFLAHGKGEALMPPKVYLELPSYNGDFRAMPGFVDGAAGLKWVNVHPDNPREFNLPTVMAVMVYNDPATGRPLAVMDGTLITRLRTAAAAAVATKYLAKPSSTSLGMVGCGVQAKTHVEALLCIKRFSPIVLYDIDEGRAKSLASSMREQGHDARAGSIEEAASCDVICCTTPSRKPVVKRAWVKPGAHINAMGADAPGKQELEPELVLGARVFVDDWAQASHSGEINVLVSEGRFGPKDLAGTLGEVVAGLKPGRTGDEITIFDSTGLAIQDIASARYFYEAATEKGVGREFPFCEFEG